MFGSKSSKINDIVPEESYELIKGNKDNPDFIILDVRTLGEFSESHIEGSELLNYQSPDFKDEVQKLDKGKTYLVYCRSGIRSAASADIMIKSGFENIYNLVGGIMGWESCGLPVK